MKKFLKSTAGALPSIGLLYGCISDDGDNKSTYSQTISGSKAFTQMFEEQQQGKIIVMRYSLLPEDVLLRAWTDSRAIALQMSENIT